MSSHLRNPFKANWLYRLYLILFTRHPTLHWIKVRNPVSNLNFAIRVPGKKKIKWKTQNLWNIFVQSAILNRRSQSPSSHSRLVTPARSQIKSIPENCDKRHPSCSPSFAWEKLLKNNYLSNGRGLPAAMTVGATRFRPPSLAERGISGCGRNLKYLLEAMQR